MVFSTILLLINIAFYSVFYFLVSFIPLSVISSLLYMLFVIHFLD